MTSYYVSRTQVSVPEGWSHVLSPGANLNTGENDFLHSFGSCDSIERDLLLLASAIFAADRATPRGEREDICRHLRISVPVTNVGRLLPLTGDIEEVLYRLSNDVWEIELRQEQGVPFEEGTSTTEGGSRTLLFSGGLDSLAAAVEYGRATEPLLLVSHHTHNTVTNKSQKDLVGILGGEGFSVLHWQFFVSSRSSEGLTDHDEENSQRVRSFLFLTLGALVARRRGSSEIIFLAENGQLAIHLPLTQGRVGAFSTHTAHPDVLVIMEDVLKKSLGRHIKIVNPYIHKTKAEVVAPVISQLPSAIPVSNSCWRNARLKGQSTHCGECIPCYVRRIAIEVTGEDKTGYARDPWRIELEKAGPEDVGRRNLVDLAEFVKRFEIASNEEVMSEWPELYSENLHADEVIKMYRRFSAEARMVLGRYPSLRALLS